MKNNAITMKLHLPGAVRCGLVLLLLALARPASFGQTATSNPPQFMAYQSYLTDQNGNPLGSTNVGPKNYNVVFRIWDIQTGGTTNGSDELYAEQQTVTVNNGYFSVLLGQGSQYSTEPHTNALSGLFAGPAAASRYVEMTVLAIGAGGANITILPRSQLLTSPYAFLAANAVNATSAGSLVNNNNSAQVVTVTNGAVGIGMSAPDNTLSVGGSWSATAGDGLDLNGNNNGGSMIDFVQTGLNGWGIGMLPGQTRLSFVNGKYSTVAGTEEMCISGANVGIGTTSPGFPLNFANVLGDKISLYDNATTLGGNSYGFGIQSGNLQIHTDNSGAAITFGYGSSAAMTEAMRITGGGNVGIGTTNPSSKLTVRTATAQTGIVDTDGTVILGMYVNSGSPIPAQIGTSSFHSLGFFTGGATPALNLTTANYVGIGTETPACPLDVETINNITEGAGYEYPPSGQVSFGGSGANVAIKANGVVVAPVYLAVSDQRIKDIVGRSEVADDLKTIRKLQVTDYRMKDRVANGDALHKGLIAQEVQQIVPEAVTKSTGFVPDIYAVADRFQFDPAAKTLRVSLAKDHGLKPGDVVRLITDGKMMEQKVMTVPDKKTFEVGTVAAAPKHVFVYGRQVNDFLAVDYNRIFTTGIGAMQELAKRSDDQAARVAALEQEVAVLKKQAAQVATLEQQMADMRKLVAQLAEAAKNSKLTARADESPAKTMTTASLDR